MDTFLIDPTAGGGGRVEIREVLLDGSSDNPNFWVSDVGEDPTYGEYPGIFPPPYGT